MKIDENRLNVGSIAWHMNEKMDFFCLFTTQVTTSDSIVREGIVYSRIWPNIFGHSNPPDRFPSGI